jgi:hypothetical protein
MSNADLTPLPGTEMEAGNRMVEQLALRFRRARLSRAAQSPMWTNLYSDEFIRVGPSALECVNVSGGETVFLFVEFPAPGKLHRATWQEVKEYLLARPLWDRADSYVFPQDLSWCVAYTHEDIHDEDVILIVGPTKIFDR